MRPLFKPTILAAAIALSGCVSSGVVEVGTVPAQTHYDDRMLDSLGSQRYTEQQMLYLRKVEQLEHNLQDLDDKRKALESTMGLSQLEASSGAVSASADESVRIGDYASATHASQSRLAQEAANQIVQQSMIENDRDRKLLDAEITANRSLAELDQKYGRSNELAAELVKAEAQRKKTQIEADAAQQLSDLEQRLQSQINNRKQDDALAREAVGREAAAAHTKEAQLLEKQRLTIALANADAERRLQSDIAQSKEALAKHHSAMVAGLAPARAEVASMVERIKFLEGKIEADSAQFLSNIAAEELRLTKLEDDAIRLSELSRTLIDSPVSVSAPVVSRGLTPEAEREIQRLESELSLQRGAVITTKASRLAEVDKQLADELRRLSNGTGVDLSNPGAAAAPDKARQAQEIRAELAATKTQITNTARTELAQLTVKTELAKADVVSPVVTGRAVYSGNYGAKPEVYAARQDSARTEVVVKATPKPIPTQRASVVAKVSPAPSAPALEKKAPAVVLVSTFEPNHSRNARYEIQDVIITGGTAAGGAAKPLVITPGATVYNVIYRYTDKGSADRFMAFLRAYGVNDFTYKYSEKLGEHVLFMGKYTTPERAASRVAYLNKTTSSNHAMVFEKDL